MSHDHEFSKVQIPITIQIGHRVQFLKHLLRKTTLSVICDHIIMRDLAVLILVELNEEILIEHTLLRIGSERIFSSRLLLLRSRLLRHRLGRHHRNRLIWNSRKILVRFFFFLLFLLNFRLIILHQSSF